MASREHFLARLLELPRVQSKDVRRGIFRQSIAALGMGDQSHAPMALAGVDPKALGRSVQVAHNDGLLADVDFLAPSAAAVGLYQLAAALPLGAERRVIGRKVLTYLYKGDAETFCSLASRMAMGSTRPLEGAGIRARVSIATMLRSAADSAVDRMALSFATRRELARTWINANAVGSLPDRRLAGRLLERAARAAAKRAEAGDVYPLRAFAGVTGQRLPSYLSATENVGAAWTGLLADRETLVWRHVAIARGLLSVAIPKLDEEINDALSTQLTPTEWRRAATSLVARIAVDRERGFSAAMGFLEGPIPRHDPGVAMAMVWGLPPVAEVEPEAAEELVEALAVLSPISIADPLVELRHAVRGFGSRAAEICADALRASLGAPELDDGLSALARAILDDLENEDGSDLVGAVGDALAAFADGGTRDAHTLADKALRLATNRVGQLEGLDVDYHGGVGTSEPRRRAMTVLRELDHALLESRALQDLLLLERPPNANSTGVEPIDDLDARLARWLLDESRRPRSPDAIKQQATLHQRQLRALLHLIDGESTDFGDDMGRRVRVRARWTLAIRRFVRWVRDQPNTRLTRAIIATVARAFDALVRDGAAEPIDVFLFTAVHFTDPAHIAIVGEASMHPDVVELLAHYLEFVRAHFTGTPSEQANEALGAFERFLHGFPSQTTLRSEAFRTSAWTLVHALRSVLGASSLRALVPHESASDAGPLAAIEDAIGQLQQLVVGAERRCAEAVSQQRTALPRRHALAHAVENAANTEAGDGLTEALTAAARAAEATLPRHLALIVTNALPRLSELDVEEGEDAAIPLVNTKRVNLPDWLPPRRILGGFYVLNQLGGGAVGTVFVVKRAEDRHKAEGERFALKVPEYNATVARTMSETEFLKLFREEAGALLSIPDHENIARFVTFDAGAKPKPILVMELIEGVSCERLVGSASLDAPGALEVLDGIMGGLEAMHGSGIAHLDVKPSNAIIRDGDGQPVLVDFGLAGRNIRPGCATLCYGAPEIWETAPGAVVETEAAAADVYAFGCFAYEVMTSFTLFDGTSDVAIISAHITHDGLPAPVERMSRVPALQPFASFLFNCLRYDPQNRASMTRLRKELAQIRPELEKLGWPLRVPA